MGSLDTDGKRYFSNNRFFADAFNYLLYDGEEIIKADELSEVDTTQITVPYGNSARLPIQKYRDLLKLWNAMEDGNAIYVLLGSELQGKVNYGMPVKNVLYDAIGYSKQIEEARRSYRRKENNESHDEGELLVEDGTLSDRS